MFVNIANKTITIFIYFFTEIRILSTISLVNSVEEMIYCPQNCGKSYKNVSCLNKHLKYECNKAPQFQCRFCDKKCKRPDNLKNHMRLVHGYGKIVIVESLSEDEVFEEA